MPDTCECLRCLRERGNTVGGLPVEATRMIVCPTCGNKRCPHASDHRHACTAGRHTSNAPHESNESAMFRELGLANALAESYRIRVGQLTDERDRLAMLFNNSVLFKELHDRIAERDAAVAERDRMRASEKMAVDDNHTLARERDRLAALVHDRNWELAEMTAERDRLRDDAAVVAELMTDKHNRYVALRDAARAFLLVLDRHEFSSISLRGKELDELRRLCE